MRAPKILTIIGLLIIILGVAFAVFPLTTEVWTPKSSPLVEEVSTVYAQSSYYPLALSPYIPKESRRLVINGTVESLKGHTFDLCILNKVNYEKWKANAPYEVYLQAKNVSSRSFSFTATKEDLDDGLRFVVLNIYAKEPAQESWIDSVFLAR
jgi:hypothetical protein